MGRIARWHAARRDVMALRLRDGRPRGQGKSELRAATWRAAHRDVAIERFYQALYDVQAQAGAATALAPPELAEHPRRHLRGDPLTLVAHRHGDRLVAADARALYHNGHDTSPVPDRVLHEVSEDLVDLVGVQPGVRQAGTLLQAETVLRLAGGDPARHELPCSFRDIHELPVYLHPAGFDSGHVEQLGDQPGDPVRVRVDRLEHYALLVVGEPAPLGEQRGGESLDGGQRGTEFVRDRGDKLGAAALKPGPLLSAPERDHEAADLPAPAVADVADGDEK